MEHSFVSLLQAWHFIMIQYISSPICYWKASNDGFRWITIKFLYFLSIVYPPIKTNSKIRLTTLIWSPFFLSYSNLFNSNHLTLSLNFFSFSLWFLNMPSLWFFNISSLWFLICLFSFHMSSICNWGKMDPLSNNNHFMFSIYDWGRMNPLSNHNHFQLYCVLFKR